MKVKELIKELEKIKNKELMVMLNIMNIGDDIESYNCIDKVETQIFTDPYDGNKINYIAIVDVR